MEAEILTLLFKAWVLLFIISLIGLISYWAGWVNGKTHGEWLGIKSEREKQNEKIRTGFRVNRKPY